MLRFHHYGPVLLALAVAGCQKSAREEQSEAINAQRSANQTAREAANERSKDVAEAQREAAKETADIQRTAGKEVAEAQREANDSTRKAVTEEVEKTSDAQRKANAETREAMEATRKAQLDLRHSVDTKLNKLDVRVRELNKEASDPKVAAAVATDARQKLTAAEAEIQSLRTEMSQLQNTSASALDQFRTGANQRIDQIEHTLDQVDDLI